MRPPRGLNISASDGLLTSLCRMFPVSVGTSSTFLPCRPCSLFSLLCPLSCSCSCSCPSSSSSFPSCLCSSSSLCGLTTSNSSWHLTMAPLLSFWFCSFLTSLESMLKTCARICSSKPLKILFPLLSPCSCSCYWPLASALALALVSALTLTLTSPY